VVTSEARKTPRGARPNRRGEPARLAENACEVDRFAVADAKTRSLHHGAIHRGEQPSGRLLDPGGDTGTRGMIAAACCPSGDCAPHRIRLTGSPASIQCVEDRLAEFQLDRRRKLSFCFGTIVDRPSHFLQHTRDVSDDYRFEPENSSKSKNLAGLCVRR